MNDPASSAASSAGSRGSTGARPGQWPLVVVGLLWLVMAAVIAGYELSRPAQIPVEWETETEFETAGFNVYRAEALDGEYIQLNSRLILSEADQATGAAYTFVDETVEPNRTYYYLLEDIEYSGNVNRHYDDITAGTFVRFEWWVLVSVPVCLLVGAVLLASGWRGHRESAHGNTRETEHEPELPAG